MKLTKEQTKIIDHAPGPAFVDAGPGTGKTESDSRCKKNMLNLHSFGLYGILHHE